MLSIEIKTIPHKKQRYDTVGDWYQKRDKMCFRISACRDRRYEWMLAIHELVERALCDVNCVSEKSVDYFDFNYKGKGEPGDSPESPYRKEHCFATAVERMLCAAMGVDWKTYDDYLCKIK